MMKSKMANNLEESYSGISASTGVVVGELVWHPSIDDQVSKSRSVVEEKKAFYEALERAVNQLKKILSTIDSNSAQFLEFQISILEDSVLLNAVQIELGKGVSAETGWKKQLNLLIDHYQELDDEYFRVRYEDFLDVRDRVLGILRGQQINHQYTGNTIFVGNDLLLSHFLEMDLRKVCGVALLRGSPASHVAILSRAKGIPYLVKIEANPKDFLEKSAGILDAHKGVLIKSPNEKTIKDYNHLTRTNVSVVNGGARFISEQLSSKYSMLLQDVINELGQKIILGKFEAGKKLPIEPELAESMKVGRNILREAIKILADKGLLTTGPRRGTIVQSRTEWNLLDSDVLNWILTASNSSSKFLADLNELRLLLEPSVVELAARRANEQQRYKIQQAMDYMEGTSGNPDQGIEADITFHSAIYEATNNEILSQLKFVTSALIKANFKLLKGETPTNLSIHRKLSDAIVNKKAIEAQKAMRELLIKNKKDLKRILSIQSKYL